MSPSFTVGIPLYNRRHCIERAVASTLEQDHPPLEVIVVDDGSTDGSGDLVDALARRDPRVRCIRQPNAGSGVARNRVLAEARGEWIAFLDSDDRWLPNKLANAAALACADPRIEFLHSNCAHVWSNGTRNRGRTRPGPAALVDPAQLLETWLIKTSTLAIRRSLLDRLAPDWFKPLWMCQDYEFMWRALVTARRIGYAEAVDTEIFVTEGSRSREADLSVHLHCDIEAMRLAAEWMRRRGGLDRYARQLDARRYRTYQQLMAHECRQSPRGALKVARECLSDLPPGRALRAVVSGALASRGSA